MYDSVLPTEARAILDIPRREYYSAIESGTLALSGLQLRDGGMQLSNIFDLMAYHLARALRSDHLQGADRLAQEIVDDFACVYDSLLTYEMEGLIKLLAQTLDAWHLPEFTSEFRSFFDRVEKFF